MKSICALCLTGFVSMWTAIALDAQVHAPRPVRQPRPVQQARYVPGLYPQASTRMLTTADIRGLTKWDLKVMRNEIFARYGYIFKTEDMIAYFKMQSWYRPRSHDVSAQLTPVEKKNIAFIQQYE